MRHLQPSRRYPDGTAAIGYLNQGCVNNVVVA
jgi:hypothetical protein